MSEHITPETLHHDTFIDLLSGARNLHLELRPGESFSGVTVDSHSDSLSVLQAGNPMGNVSYIVIHDSPHNGLMIRRINGMATPDGSSAHESAVLLTNVGDSRYLPSRRLPVMGRYLNHISHDINVELDAFRSSGEILQESIAQDWLREIKDVDAEHKLIALQSTHAKRSKAATMIGKVFGRGHQVSGT